MSKTGIPGHDLRHPADSSQYRSRKALQLMGVIRERAISAQGLTTARAKRKRERKREDSKGLAASTVGEKDVEDDSDTARKRLARIESED